MGALMKQLKAKTTTNIKSVKLSSGNKDDEEKIPEGSQILKKDVRVEVEEIENGFIINKIYDIKYMAPKKDYESYAYYTKKWYSETNPLTIDTENKELADLFD